MDSITAYNEFKKSIRRLYPSIPDEDLKNIVGHHEAGIFMEEWQTAPEYYTVRRWVRNYIRHEKTRYDYDIDAGMERDIARALVKDYCKKTEQEWRQ